MLDVSNSKDVTLFVFEKRPTIGWEFVGHGRVIENVSPRTKQDAPIWKIALYNSHSNQFNDGSHYMNKAELLKIMRLRPKYKNLALGIIPLEA